MNSQFSDMFVGAVRHVPFPMSPNLLRRIQLRRIRREPMHSEPTMSAKEVLGNPTCMRSTSIPKQYDRPAQMTQQMPQKPNDFRAFDVMAMKTDIQSKPPKSRRYGQGGNRRNSIAPVMMPDYRSFSHRCPRFTDVGSKKKSAFIEKRQMGPMSFCVFLYAAKPAFSIGRWLFHPVQAPGVPVFDNSTQNHSAVSSRRQHKCNERRNESRSSGQSVSVSTSQWCSRRQGHLLANAAADHLFPAPIDGKVGPIYPDFVNLCSHPFDAPDSIEQLNSTTLSTFLRLRGRRGPYEAVLWPGACDFPTVPEFHMVSCHILYHVSIIS